MPAARHCLLSSVRSWALILAAGLLCPGLVRAQSGQEKIIQERLERTGSLSYEPAGKAFSTDASFGGKQASVHAFGFGGRPASAKAGDGAFRARPFNDGRGSFRSETFATKQAVAADRQALSQADRSFATRSVDVREDRAAGKSMNSRAYVNTDKPFLVAGKRQEQIDDLRRQKNLTIDQVREILNKNR